MTLPEDVRTQVQVLLFAFCQVRVPEQIRAEYRLAFRHRQNTLTLYECTGPWNPRFPNASRRPVAQFRYNLDQKVWTVYWADSRQRWHPYSHAEATPDLAELIAEVHLDPQEVFFS